MHIKFQIRRISSCLNLSLLLNFLHTSMDNLTKEQRRFSMSNIKSANTKLEQNFFRILEEKNISHIKHPALFGKPDCRIGNLLIFVDSDFWHGWRFKRWKNRLPQKYWVAKIERNIKRDKQKFRILRKQGFRLIRIWEHQLKNSSDTVISKVVGSL